MAQMPARPRNILVCYDGSDIARRALDAAVGLMGYGSLLAVATVVPEGSSSANLILSEARERLLQQHVTATYVPLLGEPADELVDAARELGSDLVVVGSRSHNGTGKETLGSVVADVVRCAPCDVLVVR